MDNLDNHPHYEMPMSPNPNDPPTLNHSKMSPNPNHHLTPDSNSPPLQSPSLSPKITYVFYLMINGMLFSLSLIFII